MANGFGIHQAIEEILVEGRGLEQSRLLLLGQFAGAVREKQSIGIETSRLIHQPIPPEMRSNVR